MAPKPEDQAATAALTAAKLEKSDQPKEASPLDDDKKLSSAGAATSLKYANPRDLPSFPSAGLANLDSSAGKAANLANAHQKPFEHWKPDPSESASKAALLAKNYKAAPLWQPEASTAGSKAAAIAARDGGNVNIWRPEATEAGNSAAGQAMRARGLSPQLDYGFTADGSRKALQAATGAMSGSRARSGSSPVAKSTYPDSENSAVNALRAAVSVSKSSTKSELPQKEVSARSGAPAIDASLIHSAAITNLNREMYTSNPPVAPETDEQNRQAGLRAAAISMAKQMYDVQQRAIDQASNSGRSDSHYAATSVHNRRSSTASSDEVHHPQPVYTNLQEAAQKLAAERLAKLHDEHAAYRSYYGTNNVPQNRLSIRNRQRRRASSDGHIDESDEERSRQIRTETSLLRDRVADVDTKRRQKDRESLLAAAQRNVRASLHGMDKKTFDETGKISPAMMEEWDSKAKARAKADSDARLVNHGRVDIGGGRYLDQSEIDAIAAKRVQPTLDEITEKAEAQRARDEQLRLEEQERKAVIVAKAQDEKERSLKTKEEWKRFRDQEKQEVRTKKDKEKARKAEEKRNKDEQKQGLKDAAIVTGSPLGENPVSEDAPELEPLPHLEPISTGEPTLSPVLPATLLADSMLSDDAKSPRSTQIGSEDIVPTVINESAKDESTDRDLNNKETTPANELTITKSSNSEEDASEFESFVDPAILESTHDQSSQSKEVSSEKDKPEEPKIDSAASDTKDDSSPIKGLDDAQLIAERAMSAPLQTDSPPSGAKTAPQSLFPVSPLPEQPAKQPTLSAPSTAGLEKKRDLGEAKALPSAPAQTTVTGPSEAKTAPSATASTTVTGPSSTPKVPKGESKVSSWIKTKVLRRASKPVKPEASVLAQSSNPTADTAPPATYQDDPSSTISGNKLPDRDVNPAPKEPRADNEAIAEAPSDIASRKDVPDAEQQHDKASSISSLSTEDWTRGRSEIRREETNVSQSEDYEEARDHFDSQDLAPPTAFKETTRVSDSPVRDSKFLEDL